MLVLLAAALGACALAWRKGQLNDEKRAEIEKERDEWRGKCEAAQIEKTQAAAKAEAAEKNLLWRREQEERMNEVFQNLAQKIVDEKGEKFDKKSQELLNPLREQLKEFRQRADEIHSNEMKERASLKEQVTALQQKALKVGEDANNLTRALTGDKKMQGDWGEITLEKLLQDSGLRKGEEYQSQESVRDENGNFLRPDVIIRLPDDKHLIVDSKVSLVAYGGYVSGTKEEARNDALTEHVRAVRTHVKTLSQKHYQNAQGINSPDFVFMFMPIEPAYFAAVSADEKLFSDAYDKKIILVAPTTLMATLRTVERIWRLERQNKNAAEIAGRAGKIYDKLCGFVGDLEKIGKELKSAQDAYAGAINKLYDGSGNLIGQAEKLKELGIDAKKELPTEKPRIGE